MNNPPSATSSNIYGGFEGPNSMYIKLISSDRHEFVVRRDFAIAASAVLKNVFDGSEQLPDSYPNEVYLADIPSRILIIICRYFSYKAKYTNSSIDIPEFPIDSQDTFELLTITDFLDC